MEKTKWFEESTKRRLDKQADKWLETQAQKGVKGQSVIKSDENGILTDRQLESLSKLYEVPASTYDNENYDYSWLDDVCSEPLESPVTKVADKEYVVSIVQAQVKPFMHSAGAEKVTENMALCYELVYNQGMTFTDAGEVIGISRQAVAKNLIKLFTLAKVELYCGINVNDKVLEKFMHPSIIALRNAKERKLPKASKSDVAKKAEHYGLNAPTFNWTAQDGSNPTHPSKLTTEEKGLA